MRKLRGLIRLLSLAALGAAVAMPAGPPASAAGPSAAGHGGFGAAGHPPAAHAPPGASFSGRSFHHFRPQEPTNWRRGHWDHGWHHGRHGWWWGVGSFWYPYPAPIYPYPTYVPPDIVVEAPPIPGGPPPAQFWFLCDDPQGYYPYVASCNGPWRPVPVTPAP